jgi:hypothetical protein
MVVFVNTFNTYGFSWGMGYVDLGEKSKGG